MSQYDHFYFFKIKKMIETQAEILDIIHNNRFILSNFGVRRIGLFGSFARNEQTANSDIDFLIEFQDGQKNYDNLSDVYYFLRTSTGRNIETLSKIPQTGIVKKSILKDIKYVEITA